MNKNAGFGVIEVVVVLAVVGLLVGGVMLWWNQGGGAESLRQQFGSATHPVPTPNPREGWLKYTSELDGVSFLYPEGWKLSGGVVPNEDWPMEQVEVVSPGGLKLIMTLPVSGLGGSCENSSEECLVHVRGTDPLAELVNGQKLTVVQYWRSQGDGTRVYSMFVVDERHMPESEQFYGVYYPLFEGKNTFNNFGWTERQVISFGLRQELPAGEMTADEFFDQAEVREAELVLGSLRY